MAPAPDPHAERSAADSQQHRQTERQNASEDQRQEPERGPEDVAEAGEAEADPPEPAAPVISPAVSAPSVADKGLSSFLDTLDERARQWWSARRERRQQARDQSPSPGTAVSDQPGADAASEAGGELRVSTGALNLPQPPPRRRRVGGTAVTGPGSAAGQPAAAADAPVPPAPELPAVPAAADQVPTPTEAPESPDDSAAAQSGPQGASAEETVVLPAYRDDPPPRPVPSADPGTYSTPPTPPRVRRALDEQRRRDLIVQKARAIEDATTSYSAPQETYSGFADDEEDLYTYIPPYNLPSRDPDPEPGPTDLYRRIFVSIGALGALLSTVWMFGWFGGGEDAPAVLSGNGLSEAYSQGWYSGEYALLSPDHNVYWLWPLIAVGLIVHAAFQWHPTQESTPRQRRSGWLVGSASLLTLAATASLHYGLITLMALVSIAIAMLLLDAVRQFNLYTARSLVERRLTDGIVGLFFGFALVQAMSSVSVWLTAHGWHVPGVPALLWACIGLFVCVWVAAYYSMTERGRIAIALGLGWGMFWLIFPRLLAEVTSVWVAIGAAMGAFIVILATQSRRHRINHAERRAAMGRPLEDII